MFPASDADGGPEAADGLGAMEGLDDRERGSYPSDGHGAAMKRPEEGYSAMAADKEREREAEAWSEALIADVMDEPSDGE